MKELCSLPSCQNQAKIYISRRDRNKTEHLYCSVSCAGQDLGRRESLTLSEPMEKYSSEEPIETSQDTLNSESTTKKESETPKGLLSLEEMRKYGIIEIRERSVSKQDSEGKRMANTSGGSKEIETRRALSTELSPISEEEALQQSSLIDDSIQSCYGLAKHVMEEVKRVDQINPAEVNAACNAMKQVHALLKLKLEFHREMKS